MRNCGPEEPDGAQTIAQVFAACASLLRVLPHLEAIADAHAEDDLTFEVNRIREDHAREWPEGSHCAGRWIEADRIAQLVPDEIADRDVAQLFCRIFYAHPRRRLMERAIAGLARDIVDNRQREIPPTEIYLKAREGKGSAA